MRGRELGNAADERAYVVDLLGRLRSGTRKPQYTLERLRQMWSVPSRSSFRMLPRWSHPAQERDLLALEPWLRHASPTLRHRAVLALAEAREVEAQSTDRLIVKLDEKHGLVRIAAIEGLRMREVEDLDRIRGLLVDPVWRVRWHAAELLLRRGQVGEVSEALAASAPRRWAGEWFEAVERVTRPDPMLLEAVRERRSRGDDPWIGTWNERVDAWLRQVGEAQPA